MALVTYGNQWPCEKCGDQTDEGGMCGPCFAASRATAHTGRVQVLINTSPEIPFVRQPCRLCLAETHQCKVCPKCGHVVTYVAPLLKPKAELESTIKKRIRAALCEAGVLCWIHNVDNRNLATGLGLGTADIICVVPPHGRFLGIETKRPRGSKISANQKAWLGVVRQFGGISGIATNVTEALALVAEARQSCALDASTSRDRSGSTE